MLVSVGGFLGCLCVCGCVLVAGFEFWVYCCMIDLDVILDGGCLCELCLWLFLLMRFL